MPYTDKHLLFTAKGSLPGGEQWTCGLRTTSGQMVGVDQAVLDTYALDVANAWAAFTTSAIGWATGTALSGVEARKLSSAGVTEIQSLRAPTTAIGALSGAQLPNQCAVVVTLITPRAGRTGKGRVYLPLLGSGIGTDGRRTAAQATTCANGFATLLNSINTAIAGSLVRVGVQSQVALPSGAPVTAVRSGRVVDTQRRRRDGLIEDYVAANVTAP